MTREEIHGRFVRRFADLLPVEPFSPARLTELESALRLQLPESYWLFVSHHGAVRCTAQLGALVAERFDLWDIRSFLSPTELLDSVRHYRNVGLREGLVGFASDSMGNLFCFDRGDLCQFCDDAPVWFFDHEFREDMILAPSFDTWLESYALLPEPSRQD